LVVQPPAACSITKRALGFSRTRASSSATATPRQRLSKRLQRVTQWMSLVRSSPTISWNASQSRRTSSSTSPKRRSSHPSVFR
jgi:uncharacterized protein YciW